jgi:predicted lipoprotein with Yx(FWY)xxD motif
MSRKYVVSFAALVAAGAVLLSACGGGDSGAAAPVSNAGSGAAAESVSQNLSLLAGTARANNAKRETGDWATGSDGTPNTAKQSVAERWVQLAASRAGKLAPVVVNGAGFTLYRFDNDTANPSKSTCNGDCAKKWPSVTVAKGGRIFVSGVRKSAVGVVKRDDGRLQVTVGGWPVYRFANDTKPGDTNGQGVGGTWFGVTPDGKKAGITGDDATPKPGDDAAPRKASSAILFDDADFSDNGPSQGLAGAGCQNVARPDVTSSISAAGSLKLWSDKNCEGKSIVVNGDIKDLATIGFDDTVASVFFG